MVRHYLKGATGGAAMKGVALFLAFLMQLVAARVMGPEWYGEYTYALAWASILPVVLVAGADGAAVRFVAQFDAIKAFIRINVFLEWSHQRIVSNLKLVIPSGLILGGLLYGSNASFPLIVFFILLAAVFFQAKNLFSAAVFQGLQRPAFSLLPIGVLQPLLMILALSGFYLFNIDAHSEYVALFYFLISGAIYVWLSRFIKQIFRAARDDLAGNNESEWEEVSRQLLFMAAIGLLLAKFDILLLGWFVPVEEVGVYNVSARLAELVSLALVVSNLIMAPMIASYYQKQEREQLQQLLTFSGRLVAAVTLLLLIVLIFLGETVLGWYGELFATGYGVLLILSAGQLLNALFGPVGYLLIMTGHSSVALRMYTIAAFIMMLLAILLTPLYGMTGAAIASAIGVVIWNVIMCSYVVRHLGFDPTVFGMFRRHV